MFSLEQPLEKASAIAGAVERQGGAFKDQQFAVKNFMVRWCSELSPSLRETFSAGFRHYHHTGYRGSIKFSRSEEPTSELQSLMRISYAVFCLNKRPIANHDTGPYRSLQQPYDNEPQ